MIIREALKDIERWFFQKERKPLVIRGARQVGKTMLVRLFCEQNGLDLIELNFEEHQISEFEKEKSFDVNRAISEIEVLFNKRIDEKTILFIDEIQECSKAYNRLRFFKEKASQVALIVAGSLLEVELKKEKSSAPVGRVEFLFLGPLTFCEFLQAQNETMLVEIVKKQCNALVNPATSAIHDKLVDFFRDYLFVGGMPEAVNRFIQGKNDYLAARKVHFEIIETYRQDVRKYADGKVATVLLEIFDKMSFNIGHKVKYINFSNEKAAYVNEALQILDDIFIIQKVFHSQASGIPLAQGVDNSVFKIYLLDVGIYNSLMKVEWKDIVTSSETELINKGQMSEQFVAQHLYLGSSKSQKIPLLYWLKDKGSGNAEVDFLTTDGRRIVPIEVKAGETGSIKSLIVFMGEKKKVSTSAFKYDLKFRENFTIDVKHKINESGVTSDLKFTVVARPIYAAKS